MWRQALIDDAYARRVRLARFWALLWGNAVTLGLLLLLGILALATTGLTSDWAVALFCLVMAAMLPLSLWISAGRGLPKTHLGTYVGYAVTPDGTLHYSGVAGNGTVRPGHVVRMAGVRDCWVIATPFTLMVLPRELIPDADADRLVRHLPARRPTS